MWLASCQPPRSHPSVPRVLAFPDCPPSARCWGLPGPGSGPKEGRSDAPGMESALKVAALSRYRGLGITAPGWGLSLPEPGPSWTGGGGGRDLEKER